MDKKELSRHLRELVLQELDVVDYAVLVSHTWKLHINDLLIITGENTEVCVQLEPEVAMLVAASNVLLGEGNVI